MNIVDLDESTLPIYLVCLEDWSEEMKEAGDHKRVWYEKMKDRGLRVKLAVDDRGIVGGMIQYAPAEHSFIEAVDLYFIHCIWVHGYKQGRGNFRGRGMGTALLQAAEVDARSLGAKGIAAWGILLPFWMKASWYKKHGYRAVDRDGIQVLLWKPFAQEAVPPKLIRQTAKPPLEPNKVAVTSFRNGWCPAQNLVFERAKRAAGDPEFKDKVLFREIDTFDRSEFLRWGISDALFVNHKQVRTGPPPSFDKIRRVIAKHVKKLG